jgi:hypothetical protein
VRDAAWRKFVNARLVPEILAQGFRGVFLDSLDDPIELERRDPQSRGGMAGNALFTLLSLRLGFAWYGYGYCLSSLAAFGLAFLAAARVISRLPYETFIRANTSIP